MNRSESIKELATALSRAQGMMEGPKKTSENPFFRSKYADLASVVEAIKKPLADNGLSYVQIAHEAESAAKFETVILHSSGEWYSCGIVTVPVAKEDAQGYGSAQTYCRRYSLSAAFGVAPEDDDGNAAAKAAPAITPRAGARERLNPEQIIRVDEVISAVSSFMADGAVEDAVLTKEHANLDADESVYFWDAFDSKSRAAMKKEHTRLRALSKGTEHA